MSERTAYTVGALAYVDSFLGLIPCKVTNVELREPFTHPEVTATITAKRAGFRLGESVSSFGVGSIVPRDCVRRRGGRYRIRESYLWVPKEAK